MKAVYPLPLLPAAALVPAVLHIPASRFPRGKYLAPAWTILALTLLAFLAYRGWERYVGPGAFRIWWLSVSSRNWAFLAVLVVAGPLSVVLLHGVKEWGRENRLIPALGYLALAGATAAVLGEHLFLLTVGCALATWCAAGAAFLGGKDRKEGKERTTPPFPFFVSHLWPGAGSAFLFTGGSFPGAGGRRWIRPRPCFPAGGRPVTPGMHPLPLLDGFNFL